MLEHCSLLNESAEKLCECAERENEMLHLRKANSYKRTMKEIQKEADEIFANVEVLKKRVKKKWLAVHVALKMQIIFSESNVNKS